MADTPTSTSTSTSTPTPAPSIRGELIRGSLWMVGARWISRGIGVASTAVLARLLMPADFGLVAMAWLIIGLLEICSSFGLDYALIRNTTATREHIDTAWTLRLLQSAAVALVAVLLAPFAAAYFNEPRVRGLLYLLAGSVAIGGCANIGPVLFRRELAFASEFRFGLYSRLISTATTIVLAFSFRNYWALAAGAVAGQLANVALSYAMHPHRPRWCLAACRELWGFSQWMLWVNVGAFAQERADQLIVGRVAAAREMGLYNVAGDLASLPTSEILFPMSRVLFPGFAKLAAEPERLRAAYFSVLGFLTAVALPAGVGLALVASDLVLLMLGPQWGEAVPLLQVLALFGVFRTVCGQAGNVLLVVGRPQVVAALHWLQVAVLVPALWWAGHAYGVIGIVWTRLALGGVLGVGQVLALRSVFAASLPDTLREIWRPMLAAAGMAGSLTALRSLAAWGPMPVWAHLLAGVVLGGVSYTVCLLALWWVSGKPAGAERFVLQMVGRLAPAPSALPIKCRV